MPKKTDTTKKKRSRVRFEVKPNIQALFDLVNAFPPTDKWIDFNKPDSFLPPIKAPNGYEAFVNSPSDFDRKQLKWQKQMSEVGDDLFNTIKDKCGDIALSYLVNKNDFQLVVDSGNEWAVAERDFHNAVEILRGSANRSYKKVVDLKYQKYIEAEAKYYEFSSRYAEKLLDRYIRIKKIKKFISELSFAGRNFDPTKKQFNNLDLIDLIFEIYIDENGILHKKNLAFIEDLIGIDVRRIRQCKICRKFFWANRADRQCCEKKCADTYNKRNSRKAVAFN
jgi:hypothetical protein